MLKFFIVIVFFTILHAEKPALFLLQNYKEDTNISSWYMSEKLDGVRAYWDGEQLISRGGKVLSAPAFFTQKFPKTELDGELWSKRSDFSHISSIVNQKNPHDGWKHLTYNIFEVPNAKGNLQERLVTVKRSKYLKVIPQIQVKDKRELELFLKKIEEQGGEGVVVRDGALPYYTGRKSSALKVKSYIDTECRVVRYIDGKGKYENVLGSLVCKMKDGSDVKIGSGFSSEERKRPPEIGAIITFKYYGLTSKGKPRFPIYLRKRN